MANQQEMTLQSIASERLFEVPDYQRPYAWERKQLEDLWADLDLMSSGRHYAGTLVLRQHEGEPLQTSSGLSLAKCDVVDGQQRLTTCFLLLDRLRRRLVQMEHEDAAETARNIRATYGWVRIDGVQRPKLQLGAELREFWTTSILDDQPAAVTDLMAGQRRLKAAVDYFDNQIDRLLDGVGPEEQLRRLQTLNARVVSGLRFLVYEVSDKSDVGVIFETLNERGRPLSEMEKIKNYLLYLARPLPQKRGDDLAETINESWARIFRHLAGLPSGLEDTVLRAHWLATRQPQPREWRRTASIKARFPRSRYIPTAHTLTGVSEARPHDDEGWDRLVTEVKAYVRELEHCAFFAAELYSPAPKFVDFASHATAAREAQQSLRRTNIFALFFPVIFATRLKGPNDGELYTDVVSLCETYAASVFIIGQRRSNAGESWLNHIAHDFYKSGDAGKLRADLRAATWHYANDERISAALATSDNWYERRGHKYFLYEYERSLLAGSSKSTLRPYESFVSAAYSETTEHILPQNPAADSGWWQNFSREEHETLRHTLGNLMLTHSNIAYSNHEYEVKRGTPDQPTPCYYGGAMEQERRLAKTYDSWTPETIRQRQRSLAEWAMTRWPVERPATGEIAGIEDEVSDLVEPESDSDDEEGADGGNAP